MTTRDILFKHKCLMCLGCRKLVQPVHKDSSMILYCPHCGCNRFEHPRAMQWDGMWTVKGAYDA